MSLLTLVVSNPLPVVTLLLVLIFAWIRYVRKHYDVFKDAGIPGPEPMFLIGNANGFANKFPMDVFKDWAKEYGDVFGFYEGLRPSVVVSRPELAHEILVKNFSKFYARPVINPFLHEFQDLSLQNVSGELWKRQRQAVSAGMASRSIREMWPIMCEVTQELMDWFDKSVKSSPEGFCVDDISEKFSLDWFSRAALGYHSDAMTNDNNVLLRYMRASHASMSPENKVTGIAKLFPLLTTILKPLDVAHRFLSRLQTQEVTDFIRKYQKELPESSEPPLHNIVYNLVTRRVATATNGHQDKHSNTDQNKHSAKSELSEDEIVGEVSGLVGGGVGPFSSALSFCIHCLAVHREETERLREELEAVTHSQPLTLDHIYQLDAMDRFIYETLRLFPVAPGVSRECLEDCVVGGVNFKKGMVVRVMGSSMYCRSEFFPRPTEFIPDRFKPDSETTNRNGNSHSQSSSSSSPSSAHHMVAWLPFGLGPRMCVGQRLAMVGLKMVLANLIRDFDISPSKVTQIPLKVALRPFMVPRDGVHVKMTRRSCADVM